MVYGRSCMLILAITQELAVLKLLLGVGRHHDGDRRSPTSPTSATAGGTKHRMTLQEVRDEFKQMEGDPKIKGRIRQHPHASAPASAMMAHVPKATVIIANPTHYAVALKYDRVDGGAPLRRQGHRRRGAAHPRRRLRSTRCRLS